jgi:hypothetical protein
MKTCAEQQFNNVAVLPDTQGLIGVSLVSSP